MRAWCKKHKRVNNMYPEWNKDSTKILFYKGKCGCKFKESEIEDIKVHHKTLYFLKDGTQLIPPNKEEEWTIKQKK